MLTKSETRKFYFTVMGTAVSIGCVVELMADWKSFY